MRYSRPWPVIAAVLVAVLAACQPLPRPFADDRPPRDDPSLAPPDSVGIVVLPVNDTPSMVSAALAEAMADALQKKELLASTRAGNKRAYLLQGSADAVPSGPGLTRVRLQWDVLTGGGESIGTSRQEATVGTAEWEGAAPAALGRIAGSRAEEIAALVLPPAPTETPQGPRHVAVVPVTGAPGDGNMALTRALLTQLRLAEFDAVEAKEEGGALRIAGTVKVEATPTGQEKVTIVWTVFDSDNRQVGQVNQDNTIPKGSLNKNWGDIAFAVASGASDGLITLLKNLPAGRI